MRCGRSRASLLWRSLLVSRGVPVPVCCGVPLPLAFPCHWYSSLAPPTLPWRLCQQPLCHCGVPCMPLRHCGAPARLFATAPQPVSSSAAAPVSSIFPMALRCSAQASNIFPMVLHCGAQASKSSATAPVSSSATAPLPATNLIWRRRVLQFG